MKTVCARRGATCRRRHAMASVRGLRVAKSDKKTVTTSVVTSKKVAKLDHFGERMWWRVYFSTDAHGTLKGDAWDIVLKCAPGIAGADAETVEEALCKMQDLGLIVRWTEAAGEHRGEWLEIVGHDEHHTKEHLRKRGKRRAPLSPWATIEGGASPANSASRAPLMAERPDTAHQVEVEGGEDVVLDPLEAQRRAAYANWTAARDRHPDLRERLDQVGPEAFQAWLNDACPADWVIHPDELTPMCVIEVPLAAPPRALLTVVPPISERDPAPSGRKDLLNGPVGNHPRPNRSMTSVTALPLNGAHSTDHHDGPVPA